MSKCQCYASVTCQNANVMPVSHVKMPMSCQCHMSKCQCHASVTCQNASVMPVSTCQNSSVMPVSTCQNSSVMPVAHVKMPVSTFQTLLK